MLLDWNDRTPPTEAEIAALRPALDHIKLAVANAFCADDRRVADTLQGFLRRAITLTTASLDMAISRAQRSLRAFKLRRILLELLQNSDSPMTIAAIWEEGRRGEFGRPPGGDYRRPHLFAQQRLPVRAGRQG